MYLDHVAIATRDVTKPLATLVGELGGTVLSGGHAVGFRPMQVYLGGEDAGMKVELLEPWEPERNDFLVRFLDRHGDGPHHLTFKVDDIEKTLEQVAGWGITPVSVDLSDPVWREAFLLPRDAHGTVIQLADSDLSTGLPRAEYRVALEHGPMGSPQWWPEPPPRADDAVTLVRVVLRTDDVAAARELFSGLLGGRLVGGVSADAACELDWPSGARLCLEPSTDGRRGIDRLELLGEPARTIDVCGLPLVVQAPD